MNSSSAESVFTLVESTTTVTSHLTPASSTIAAYECIPGSKFEEFIDYDLLKHVPAVIPDPYPRWEVAVKVAAYVVAITLGIVGNSAVLAVLATNKSMRTTTNVYIANLAVCDLLVCCTCMWIHVGKSVRQNWPFGEFFCRFNAFSEGKRRVMLHCFWLSSLTFQARTQRHNCVPLIRMLFACLF